MATFLPQNNSYLYLRTHQLFLIIFCMISVEFVKIDVRAEITDLLDCFETVCLYSLKGFVGMAEKEENFFPVLLR